MRFGSIFGGLFAAAVLATSLSAGARPVAPLAKPGAAPAPGLAQPANAAPIIPLTTVHPTAYDVRIHVEPDGMAVVEHTLAIRVSGGWLRSLDLKANDPKSVPTGEASVVSEDGHPVHVALSIKDDGAIHVESAEEKGWKRGAYTVRFALKTDLEKIGALRRDGVLYRLAWQSPILSDGVDGMRVVFDLPAAPTEPRAVSAGNGAAESDDGLLATLRRSAARDELEIVRPHVGRGEAVMWEARVDPRALPALRSPALAPRPLATAAEAPSPKTPFGIACAAGLFVAALAFAKERARGMQHAGVRRLVRWVPLPASIRVVLAAALSAGALLAFVDESPLLGAVLVASTCAILACRTAGGNVRAREDKARGPGEWLALRPGEAFAKLPASMMTLSSWRGRVAFVCALAAFALVAWAVSVIDPRVPSTFALLGSVIPTLWAADPRSQLDRARGLLARAHSRLRKNAKLRSVPFVRVPKGGTSFEEVRLRMLPRHPMPGLLALEMGSAGEAIELFVRVRDDSPASRRLAQCAAVAAAGVALRTVPGRSADERVLALQAPSPTLAAACQLAVDIGALLVDRRDVAREAYEGQERRALATAAAAA